MGVSDELPPLPAGELRGWMIRVKEPEDRLLNGRRWGRSHRRRRRPEWPRTRRPAAQVHQVGVTRSLHIRAYGNSGRIEDAEAFPPRGLFPGYPIARGLRVPDRGYRWRPSPNCPQ